MTLAEFKQTYGVQTINLYPSTVSKRLVGSVVTKKGEQTIITKEEFDATQPIYVYPTDAADSDGVVSELIVLSNKAPKTPALTL